MASSLTRMQIKKYWDHSTKPSTYVVCVSEREPFRGSYVDGILYIKSLDNGGMISFQHDYIPSAAKIKKTAYRALMVEKQLRREIIKLKKQIATS